MGTAGGADAASGQPLAALTTRQPELQDALARLGSELGLPQIAADSCDAEFCLHLTRERLELRRNGESAGPVYCDFVSGRSAYRRRCGGGRDQPLARAVGLKQGRRPLVLDATAGLGRDAFVLAALGCELILLERAPVVFALLRDGLKRALADQRTASVAARMQLHCTDAVVFLERMDGAARPDVIYMDPMYPQRTKQALVKKEMRMLQQLLGQDGDSARLLSCARRQARYRVVVKRPAGAEWLGGEAPTMVIESPNTRYDVYQSRPFDK